MANCGKKAMGSTLALVALRYPSEDVASQFARSGIQRTHAES